MQDNSLTEQRIIATLWQIAFIALNLVLFIFVKTTTSAYILDLQQIAPDLAVISNITDQTTQQVQAEQLIATLGPSTQTVTFLLFVVTPLMLLTLWIICQGTIWRKCIKMQVKTTTYYLRITLSTLIAAGILLFMVLAVSNPVILLILGGILYYLLTISYLTASTKDYKKEYFSALKKVMPLGPWMLLLFLTSLAILVLILVFVISYTSGIWFAGSLTSLIIYTLLITLLNVYLKTRIATIYSEPAKSLNRSPPTKV